MNILIAKALAVDEETVRTSHIKKAQTELRALQSRPRFYADLYDFRGAGMRRAQTAPAISPAISTPDRSTRASGRRRHAQRRWACRNEQTPAREIAAGWSLRTSSMQHARSRLQELPRRWREGRRRRYAPHLQEVEHSPHDLWGWAKRISIIGLFCLALGYTAFVTQSVLVPIILAWVVGTILLPLIEDAARRGIPRALAVVVVAFGSAVHNPEHHRAAVYATSVLGRSDGRIRCSHQTEITAVEPADGALRRDRKGADGSLG